MTAAADQVAQEARVRPRYAALTFAAALLIVAAQLIQLSGPKSTVSELTIDLILAHKRFPLDLIGSIVDGFGLVALALALGWLQQISRARSPEQQRFVRWLALIGGFLSGVMAVAYAIVIANKANEFVSSGNQSYVEAKSLTSGTLIVVLPLLAQLGSFLLAGGVIWISLNAMRVGLLPKLLGWVGVFAGAFVLFPVGAIVPVVQGFWLAAVALVIYGRWPQGWGGTPPAWDAGVAVPWPAAQRASQAPRREPRQRRGSQAAATAVAVTDDPPPPRTSASAKRKRKRRR
jgi:hypothetical protein